MKPLLTETLALCMKKKWQGIIHIPETEFLCRQLDITPEMDLLEILRKDFDADQLKLAIVANMPLAKTSFNSWHSEIQVPV